MKASASHVVGLVDDDARVRRALASLLGSAGLHVEAHSSAEDFLASLRVEPGASRKRGASCLVLDLHLPGMSGLDLLHRLNTDGWLSPVIIVSGQLGAENVRRCLLAGAVACLPKPCSADELIRNVNECLRYHGQS